MEVMRRNRDESDEKAVHRPSHLSICVDASGHDDRRQLFRDLSPCWNPHPVYSPPSPRKVLHLGHPPGKPQHRCTTSPSPHHIQGPAHRPLSSVRLCWTSILPLLSLTASQQSASFEPPPRKTLAPLRHLILGTFQYPCPYLPGPPFPVLSALR